MPHLDSKGQPTASRMKTVWLSEVMIAKAT